MSKDDSAARNEENQLRLDAVDAKYGADIVAQRLRTAMEHGAPSIADLAYAFRIRVKDDYKIIEKVRRKRAGRSEYGVSHLRDIVGLRIVTLYRLDALDVIPKLLELIERDQKDSNGLFASKLEEVKIYSTNPGGDAQALPQRLSALFQSFGYPDAEIVAAPSNYSSIHIVVWCRGKYNGTSRTVPLEIQVRTVFEDAWSEIDHRLKYKPDTRELTLHEQSDLDSCLRHLNVMKTMIDGVAQYADQIRVQEQMVRAGHINTTSSRTIEDTRGIVRSMADVPAHIRHMIDHALDSQEEGMHSSRRAAKYAPSRIGSLRHAITTFGEAYEAVCATLPAENEDRKRLSYYLPMERALCLYQLGAELNKKEHIAEAVRIYKEVQLQHPDRAIPYYRLARALDALGDGPSAITQFREAQLKLRTDVTVPALHSARVAIPRNLGFALWAEAERRKEESRVSMPPVPGSSGTAPDVAQWRDLYLAAFSETTAALDIRVEPDPSSSEFEKRTRHRGLLINNLLYYALDYLRAGGAPADLDAKGLTSEKAKEYVQELAGYVDVIDSPRVLDTILVAARHFSVPIDARKVALRSRKIFTERGQVEPGISPDVDDMLRTVAETLGEPIEM